MRTAHAVKFLIKSMRSAAPANYNAHCDIQQSCFDFSRIYSCKVGNNDKSEYSNMIFFCMSVSTTVVRVLLTVVSSRTSVKYGPAKGIVSITLCTGEGCVVRNFNPQAASVNTRVEMSDLFCFPSFQENDTAQSI